MAADSRVPSPARFSKAQRVRRRAEFQQVFEKGTRLHSRYFTLLLLPNGRSFPRLGIVASRKIGNAVQRNRAKRLIREMFRQRPDHAGAGVDAVVIPRRDVIGTPYPDLTQDFRSAWRRGTERVLPRAGR